MTELSEALLAAHVAHELERWRGERGRENFERTIAAAFRWLESLPVREILTPTDLMGIIERYVIDMRMSGGVTELAGEMARVVFNSPRAAETRLDEVLSDTAYERFSEKVAGLEGVRRELVGILAGSEAFGAVAARLMIRTALELVLGPRSERLLGARLLPALERRVAQALARRSRSARDVEHHLLDALDPESVRSVADEIWIAVSSRRLADAFALITEDDLEDFVALGYEFWLRYRKSDYFRAICSEVLRHFFAKYGDSTLGALALDMGVTEAMVVSELTDRFSPLLQRAADDGLLERQLRAQLAPFYRARSTLELLASRP